MPVIGQIVKSVFGGGESQPAPQPQAAQQNEPGSKKDDRIPPLQLQSADE